MTRDELIRMLVLNEISDDYEESEHVFENVSERGRNCGISVEVSDVNRTLLELVNSGSAKAYDLWKNPPEELQTVPEDDLSKYYYWITPKGLEAHSSFEGWPFDDEGVVLPGWIPPSQ